MAGEPNFGGGDDALFGALGHCFRSGVEAFARDLAAAGGLGMITPDLIPDEADEWIAVSDAHQLDRIFLVAPSSTHERLAATVEASRGFVYAASTMGVTGARDAVSTAAPELVRRVKEVSDIPVGVGLGVRSREQAAQIAVEESVREQSKHQQCLQECVRAAVAQAQPGDARPGVGDDRIVHGGEGFRGPDRVVAESLDAEQAPVGGDADLPQRGQISQPFPDAEVVGVVDRGFRHARRQ